MTERDRPLKLIGMHIRKMDRSVAEALHRNAAARGMRIAEYIAALVALHNAIRIVADAGDTGLQAELEGVGLETVSR